VFLNPEVINATDAPLTGKATRAHVHMPRPPEDLVMLRGTLAEWSLDALGWLTTYLSEACVRNGVGEPILITADRGRSGDS
jgi:hypothetical protein